jgi:hypothetical protein
MKLNPASRHDPRTPRSAFCVLDSALRTPHSEGIALVITLILLAIITFMAVTFLVVSTAERRSVTGETDQTIARFAADAALERANAELLSRIMAATNESINELVVSTNYYSAGGFVSVGSGVSDLTNVNYSYPSGAPLSQGDLEQNIANLFYNARAPVIMTNRLTGSNEFRFYLDLNRNGRFEDTGLVPVQNDAGFYFDGTQWTQTMQPGKTYWSNYFVGDPQWIGLLERPGLRHSSSNYFTARVAYMAVPASKGLDLNYIHNDVSFQQLSATMANGFDGFRRDQGAGTYEINLAAFLADLNTNLWFPPTPNEYNYRNTNNPSAGNAYANQGIAFADALSLLRYRYNSNPNLLSSPSQMFGTPGMRAFQDDTIDACMFGPLMTNTWWSGAPDYDSTAVDKPWPGSDNPTHFFGMQDLFDPAKTAINIPSGITNFTDRLMAAGNGLSTYDRYTFFRLLAQLGTDTPAEPATRMNINYDNLVKVNPTNGVKSATNFFSWDPTDFFVNASYRLLTNAGYTFPMLSNMSRTAGMPTTGIMIYPTNFYTPSVHRLFQLAANIYDATTNRLSDPGSSRPLTNGMGFPTVFRPVFNRVGSSSNSPVFIVGFSEVTNATIASYGGTAPNMLDLNNQTDRTGFRPLSRPLFYGFPLVIGAKKGWPNFNEFAMQTQVQVTRKLQFVRDPSGQKAADATDVSETNQMYLLCISNILGAQGWNSYFTALPRNLLIITVANIGAALTNESGANLFTGQTSATNIFSGVITTNNWLGFQGHDDAQLQASFMLPLLTNYFNLTNSQYVFGGTRFVGMTGNFEGYGTTPSRFPIPRWYLSLNTKLRFIIVDTDAKRIIDYVNLDSAFDPTNHTFVDITSNLMYEGFCGSGSDAHIGSLWCTNRPGNASSDTTAPYGVLNQIGVCIGAFGYTEADVKKAGADWSSFIRQPPYGDDIGKAIAFFKYQFIPGVAAGVYAEQPLFKSNIFYSPFDPTRPIYVTTSWQANDPLVHYTIPDLTTIASPGGVAKPSISLDNDPVALADFQPGNEMAARYHPWGATDKGQYLQPDQTQMLVKDPVATGIVSTHPDTAGRSDDWDFPTNKLPNIGWLGRVHRGTPWQTVYLKSPVVDPTSVWPPTNNVWVQWTGNSVLVTNIGQINPSILRVWSGLTNDLRGVASDAGFSQPLTDRGILDLFSTALNENSTRGRLSVNQTNLAAWSAVLAGVNVLPYTSESPPFPWTSIQPAGVYDPSDPPAVVKIVNAINDVRRTNFVNGVYRHLGDILATPELTVNPYLVTNSPFLNLQDPAFLNDEDYERIPQQVLGLLQCYDPSAPRFIIYCYGQALKPAEHSLVTGTTFFGLCTNYQVTAETATRAVVHIEGPLSNQPRIVIDSFNVLPPD